MKIYFSQSPLHIKDFYDLSVLASLDAVDSLSFNVSRYRYFVVQLFAVSPFYEKNLEMHCSALVSDSHIIKNSITIINTQGIDASGNHIDNKLSLQPYVIQPLFIGFDLSKANLACYKSVIKIGRKNVEITLNINDDIVFYQGDDDICGLSRLRWLNSNLMRDKSLALGYEPILIDKNQLSLTGKKLTFNADGLLSNMDSYFNAENSIIEKDITNRLFYQPMTFTVDGQQFKYNRVKISNEENICDLQTEGKSKDLLSTVSATINYEGMLDYTITLTAIKDIIIPDVSLQAYFSACTYSMGLGKKGGLYQDIDTLSWNSKKHNASLFVGDVNCGARIKLINNTTLDKVSFEQANGGWNNFGTGTISLKSCEQGAVFTARTGEIILPKDRVLEYKFRLHLTPFRTINYARHFSHRALQNLRPYQNYDKLLEEADHLRLNFINIVSLNKNLENINYPYLTDKALINAILEAHIKNIGINLSYSAHEISCSNPERNIYRAFGGELLKTTDKACPIPQAISIDNSVLVDENSCYTANKGSRLENYYVEGVNYLINKYNIDGLFIKDPVLKRDTVERVSKLFSKKKSINGGVEIAIKDTFNKDGEYQNTLDTLTEILPFVDRIGAYAKWNDSHPDYILTEIAGLPFGLTAEPLDRCGSPYLGLLFGMNARYGYGSEKDSKVAESIYQLWEYFDIKNAQYYGYWNENKPISVDKKDIKLSVYEKNGNMLVVVYNTAAKKVEFELGIDTKKGFTSKGKRVYKPLIVGLQASRKVNLNKSISLKKHDGMIIIIENKRK